MLSFIDDLLKANEFQVFVSLLATTLLSVVIGFSKELFNKPAGFRVNILISLTSCLVAILIPSTEVSSLPLAILGAGLLIALSVIILGVLNNNRGEYYGMIGSVIILLSGVVGFACGLREYFVAVVTTVLAMIIMFVMRTVEKSVLARGYVLNIVVDSKTPVLKEMLRIFEENRVVVTQIESKIVLFEQNECLKLRVEFLRATDRKTIEECMIFIKETIKCKSITLRNDTYGVVR